MSANANLVQDPQTGQAYMPMLKVFPENMYQNQMHTNAIKSSNGDFEQKLFSCFDDPETCLIACCFPCVIYGKNHQRITQKPDSIADACVYFWAVICGITCCVGGSGRGAVRVVRGIDGGCCEDCCIHLWCSPCALTQEKLELDKAAGLSIK